jgi:hypothetical protein
MEHGRKAGEQLKPTGTRRAAWFTQKGSGRGNA